VQARAEGVQQLRQFVFSLLIHSKVA
jgi:hypothetical protein